MSRKTSSIVNRLNITYFWSFKKYSWNYEAFHQINNIFKLIKGFLILNKIYLLYYYFKFSYLNSLEFTGVVYYFNDFLKKDQLNFFEIINWQFYMFYYQSYFNFFILNWLFFFKLSLFFLNRYFFLPLNSLSGFINLYYFNKFMRFLFLRLLLTFNLLENKFLFLLRKKKLLLIKLNFVFIKNIEFYLKLFLFKFFKKEIQVNIINIFNFLKKQNYILHLTFFKFFKFKNLDYFWNFINVFYLCLLFHNMNLIVIMIASGIERKKKLQKKYIFSIITLLKQLYLQRVIAIRGLRLTISGKIDSKVRKKYITFTKGTLSLQKFKTPILYALHHHDTKFGVISIKFLVTKY